jgi:mRNA interferase MazF
VAALEADDCLGGTNIDECQRASFMPGIEVEGNETRVLVEQMGAVDVNRLGELSGHLSSEEQWGFDAAILMVLGRN